MNTEVSYMYRDGANWKTRSSVVLKGAISPEQEKRIWENLVDELLFIPEAIGLLSLSPETWGSDDHPWHELTKLKLTEKDPNQEFSDMSIGEFVRKIEKMTVKDWENIGADIGIKHALEDDDDEEDESLE